MKRILSALLVICMIFSVVASVSFSVSAVDVTTPKNIFFAKYIGEGEDDFEGEAPVIDGKINPDEWLESDFKAWPKAPENNISFYYDEENIYIAARIENEEYNLAKFPALWWQTGEWFYLWIDPYDEDINPANLGYSASYFMEFHTNYVNTVDSGKFETELYTAGANYIGPEIPPLLNYYDVECKSNTDDLFQAYADTFESSAALKESITYEGDKPWGLDVPNGIWEFEYKIPFGLMNVLDIENDITLTDTEEWGTYIAFSGWYIEQSHITKAEYLAGTGSGKADYIAGRNRASFDYAACYFSDARPGQVAAMPGSKSLGDINPSGEEERTLEEAGGWTKEKVSSKITVNGKLDDAAWTLNKTTDNNPLNGFDTYYDVQWDEKYLYIAVDTGDTDPSYPEDYDFHSGKQINSASFDNIAIQIDPKSTRDDIALSDRGVTIRLPRAELGSEDYITGPNGNGWLGTDFVKGLSYNYDMKVRYENAMVEGKSWTAEIAIPWEMFNRDGDALFPTASPELFDGENVEIFIGYMNSAKKVTENVEEIVSGEDIVIVTNEAIEFLPQYNSLGGFNQPYTFSFLRMVADAGEYSKEVKDDAIAFKVDTKFLEQNTYNLRYKFDASDYNKASVEIPVTSLNRQNYSSYYVTLKDGIEIEIPSGILTDNLIKEDKAVSLDDKVVFEISKTDAEYPEVTLNITIDGKTIYPETALKLTYPLDIEVATTEYDAFRLQVKDAEGQVYPLTNVKFYDKYNVVKVEDTTEEIEECIDRKYIAKSALSGTYSMVEYITSAVDNEGWFKPYVENVMKYGLMKGYDEGGIKFKPNQNISRAEVATLVMRLTQKSVEIPANGEKFVDVKDNDWFNTIVYRAKELGFVNGVGNGKFDPNAPITRGDFFTLIERALTKMDIEYNELDHIGFSQKFGKTDYNMFSENRGGRYAYAYAGAVFCFSNGIVVGNEEAPGQFWMRPERAITRAEIATLVSKLMDNFIIPQAN